MRDEDKAVGAVLFDYGMVLSGPQDPAALRRMEAVLGVTPEALQGAYWRFRDAYDRGALTGEAYWRAVIAELGRSADGVMLEALLAADLDLWGQPNEPMIAWAAALQRSGMPTGVLSNLGDAMEAGLRARHPWLEGFAHCTYSHRLGMAKPDAAIYREAARGLDVAVERVLFLDDREENVAGARAVGMQAVQYTGHAAFVRAMQTGGWGWLLEIA